MINGKLLKELRKAHGLSQLELAQRVGVNRATIYMAENGHHQMRLVHFKRLCEVLGADSNELLGLDTDDTFRRQAMLTAYLYIGDQLDELTHA